jgi:phosphohistidine phosphatase
MKRLVILRHAKTERDHPDGDRLRRLTARGERDAAAAGAAIAAGAGIPDVIVTSSAARATQTAQIVAREIGYTAKIIEEPALYLAEADELIDAVRTISGEVSVALLVGHNPGFLDLINWLAGPEDERGHLPTAAFAVVSIDVEAWKETVPDRATVSPIIVPR